MGNEILMDDGLLGLQPRAQIGEDLLEQLDGLTRALGKQQPTNIFQQQWQPKKQKIFLK